MPLTAHQVAAASARPKLYAQYDGHGLCLHVTPKGSKLWRFRYSFWGREKMISLGRYPRVSLQHARRRHADARGLVIRGIDPSVERRLRRANEERTFESVARSWLKSLDVQVNKKLLTQNTSTDARRLLERHIFPGLGRRPIGSIGPRDLLVVLKEIELQGLLHTARRTKQRCSRVFRHAIGVGYLSRDITEGLRGFLRE